MYSLIRNKQGFLCTFFFLFFSGNIALSNAVYTPAYDTTHIQQTINLPAFQKDTTGKVKLLQKIIASLQFRKNARAREQQRVITIIRSVMADSMVATADDIRRLNAELSLQQNQHFDSLRALINAIIASQEKDTLEDTGVVPEVPPAPVTETDVASLVNKLIPILQQKDKEERNSAAQQQHLTQIRALYGRPRDKMDTLLLSDTLGRTYTITLGHKAAVIGVHPYWMNDKYLHYNYSALSAVSFYGYTTEGNINAKNIPASVNLFSTAAAAGNTRTFTLYENDAKHIDALLKDEDAQFRCIDSLLPLLEQHQADGINIWFSHVGNNRRDAFTRFVTLMSNYFQRNSEKHYHISVTIPPYDEHAAYDLRALDPLTDHFLIDFTKATGTRATALSPMKGDARKAIEPVMSRLMNQQIAPSKFILLLSYYGTQWKKGRNGGKDSFAKYVSYNEIKSRFPGDTSIMYDEDAVAAFVEEKNEAGEVSSEIWFDDASTLEVKYDYVLNNGLGGVAIWSLGADDGYGELWDVLADRFISIDTTFVDTVRLIPAVPVETSWLGGIIARLKHEARVLQLLFTDPCDLEKEHDKDDRFFAHVTLFFFCLTVLLIILYAYNVRMEGTTWKWKKPVLRILVGMVLLTLFFAIVALFLNRDVPFGMTDNYKPGDKCATIPMLDLLLIFSIGLIIGMLIMRVMIGPLLTRDDKP